MIDLANIIDENTKIISDTHFGHWKVLIFESVRTEYLMDYNTDVAGECAELLDLISQRTDEGEMPERMMELAKFLINFHDEMLVEKWNSVVSDEDTVLHLGDFAFRNIAIAERLNGKKILLRGNHDLKSERAYKEVGFLEVIENIKVVIGNNTFELSPRVDKFWNGFIIAIDGQKILFSHYPIFNNNIWDVKRYGKITDLLESIVDDYGVEINIHGHTHTNMSDWENCINVSLEHCTGLKPITIGSLIGL